MMDTDHLKGLRRLIGLLPLIAVSACVTVDVGAPESGRSAGNVSNPTARNTAATYDTAMDYLQSTRTALLVKARNKEAIDTSTKVGVAIGVAGAGVSASLSHHAEKRAIKFLTLGAVSYMANRDTAPAVLAGIYRAGVGNLECIRTAAIVAKSDVDALRADLTSGAQVETKVATAILALQSDIEAVAALPLPENGDVTDQDSAGSYAVDVQNALTAISGAKSSLKQVRTFVDNDGLGERVLSGVNGTLQVVNQQALARSPDIDTILQSGSVFGTFLDSGASWAAQIKGAQGRLATALNTSQSGTVLHERFLRDQIRLQAALALIPNLSIDADLAAISQCRTVIGVLKPVTVSPNPVVVTVGGDPVKLALTGNAPFTIHWGEKPADVIFDSIARPPTLTAGAASSAGEYTFHMVDNAGVDSGEVTLKVQAKAKPAAAGEPSPSAQDAAGKPDAAPKAEPAPGGPPATPKTPTDAALAKKAGDAAGLD